MADFLSPGDGPKGVGESDRKGVKGPDGRGRGRGRGMRQVGEETIGADQ
jgi:hypothetical protein